MLLNSHHSNMFCFELLKTSNDINISKISGFFDVNKSEKVEILTSFFQISVIEASFISIINPDG